MHDDPHSRDVNAGAKDGEPDQDVKQARQVVLVHEELRALVKEPQPRDEERDDAEPE